MKLRESDPHYREARDYIYNRMGRPEHITKEVILKVLKSYFKRVLYEVRKPFNPEYYDNVQSIPVPYFGSLRLNLKFLYKKKFNIEEKPSEHYRQLKLSINDTGFFLYKAYVNGYYFASQLYSEEIVVPFRYVRQWQDIYEYLYLFLVEHNVDIKECYIPEENIQRYKDYKTPYKPKIQVNEEKIKIVLNDKEWLFESVYDASVFIAGRTSSKRRNIGKDIKKGRRNVLGYAIYRLA